MTLKYGYTVNEIEAEEAGRDWFKPAAEFSVMAVILLLILGAVTYRASTKSVVINESTKIVSSESMFDEEVITEWTIMPVSGTAEGENIIVPIPLTARPENVTVENYYQDHTLLIRIKGLHSAAFEEAKVSGNTGHLITAAFREYTGEIRISLLMDGVWDYDISQENTQLVITPFKADERYSRSIVLVTEKDEAEENAYLSGESAVTRIAELAADIGSGGRLTEESEEEDAVAKEDSTDLTRIYVAEYRSDEEVLMFLEEVGAEYVVFLKTGSSSDPSVYGMSAEYNGSYFNPELDNAVFSEAFLRNMATSSSNRAVSIERAGSDSILDRITIPATEITVGYISNERENECLNNEAYCKKIAEGIINAVKEVTVR